MNFILKDLNTAIAEPNLPNAKSLPTSEIGRITKEAAMAFRARVLMFYGNYGEALKDLKAVVESGSYELVDGYSITPQRAICQKSPSSSPCALTFLATLAVAFVHK